MATILPARERKTNPYLLEMNRSIGRYFEQQAAEEAMNERQRQEQKFRMDLLEKEFANRKSLSDHQHTQSLARDAARHEQALEQDETRLGHRLVGDRRNGPTENAATL